MPEYSPKKKKKKTALIAGASGLTGSHLLQLLLDSPHYRMVKALVRRPLNIEHPSLQQIVYDYEKPDPKLIQANHVYSCLGTTMKKAGSKSVFKRVDHDYTLELARTAHQNGATRFALVSAVGADTRSMFFYNRVKGELEEAVKEIPFEAIYIMRPSILLGPRKESRPSESLGKTLMQPLRFFMPPNMRPIHASQVAAGMLDQMVGGKAGIHTLPSGWLRKYPTG